MHLIRHFLPSLQRCWPYRHWFAILVKDVPAIFVNQDEPLNILAQGELPGLQHGLAVGQKIAQLSWHKIREILSGPMRHQLIQQSEAHHEVRQCKLASNQHIHDLAIWVIFLPGLDGARLQRAGKESENAIQFVVKPLFNRLLHIMPDNLCHGPLRLDHVALKSLALGDTPFFEADVIDWQSIDFRTHFVFEVWGFFLLPLLLERWIRGKRGKNTIFRFLEVKMD